MLDVVEQNHIGNTGAHDVTCQTDVFIRKVMGMMQLTRDGLLSAMGKALQVRT
jgi:hypothetical protein